MRIVLLVLPPRPGSLPLQTDAVVSRCFGIRAKSPYYFPPLGLMYIARILRPKKGVELFFLDAQLENLDGKELLGRLRQYKAELVIVALPAPDLHYSLSLLEKIRNQGAGVVVAGPVATVLYKELLCGPGIDYAAVGEPETVISQLVDALLSGRELKGEEEKKGLSFLAFRKEKRVLKCFFSPLIDFSTMLPDRILFPLERYFLPMARKRRSTTLLASRGCPYNCTFCTTNGMYGKSFRKRSPDSVLEEVEELIVFHSFRDLTFMDDIFTFDRKWLSLLLENFRKLQKKRGHFGWICLTRPDLVDRALLEEMKVSGCYQIQFGVESIDREFLESVNKRLSPADSLKAFRLARNAGIETAAFLLLGREPGEPGFEKELEMLERFVEEARPDFLALNKPVILARNKEKNILEDFETAPGWLSELNLAFYRRPRCLSRLFLRTLYYDGPGGLIRMSLPVLKNACRIAVRGRG